MCICHAYTSIPRAACRLGVLLLLSLHTLLSGCRTLEPRQPDRPAFRISEILPDREAKANDVELIAPYDDHRMVVVSQHLDARGKLRWRILNGVADTVTIDSGSLTIPAHLHLDNRNAVFDILSVPPYAYAIVSQYLIRLRVQETLQGRIEFQFDSSLRLDHPYLGLARVANMLAVTHAYYAYNSPLHDSIELAMIDPERMSVRRMIRIGDVSGLALTLFQPRRLLAASRFGLAVADADRYRIRIFDTAGRYMTLITRPELSWTLRSGLVDSITSANAALQPKGLMDVLRPLAYGHHAIRSIDFVNDSVLLVTVQTPESHQSGPLEGKVVVQYDLWHVGNGRVDLYCRDILDAAPTLEDRLMPGITWPIGYRGVVKNGRMFMVENVDLEGLMGLRLDDVNAHVKDRLDTNDKKSTLMIISVPCQ